MYLGANFNTMIYDTTTIRIAEGKAEIGLAVTDKFHHALGGTHGSVYFKMLDDAAFFAVNSIVQDHFVLTTSFNVNFVRPFSEGSVRAYGEVRFQSSNLFTANATLVDQEGIELAFGTGNFTKSRVELSEDIGYV
jgi:uncharacterized protein (TIGR00369 family)